MSNPSDLTFAQANEIVLDQLEKMKGEICSALQATVDPRVDLMELLISQRLGRFREVGGPVPILRQV